MTQSELISRGLRGATFVAMLAYGFFVMGYPSGYTLTHPATHVRLIALGFVGGLLMRSFWSLAFLPFAIIAGAVAAGIRDDLIRNVTQGVAGFAIVEVWTYWSTALGALLGTVLVKLVGRSRGRRRASATPEPSGDHSVTAAEVDVTDDSTFQSR